MDRRMEDRWVGWGMDGRIMGNARNDRGWMDG